MNRFLNPLNILNVTGVIDSNPEIIAPLRLTCTGASATVSFFKSSPLIELQYSLNGTSWQDYSSTISLTAGDYIELRGDNRYDKNGVLYHIGNFYTTGGDVEASGSVMSLIYGALLNKTNNLVFEPLRDIGGLFDNCTNLTKAPELPATTLSENCYSSMFNGTGIITAPELPATNLKYGCYGLMFHNCANLTSAPTLPATELAGSCYANMFSGCASLVQAPELPAEQLADDCYYGMFANCSLLAYVSIAFIAWDGTSTDYWLDSVSPTGTFRCPASLDQSQRDESHIPAGWTIETY